MNRGQETTKAALDFSPCMENKRDIFIKGAQWADDQYTNRWHSVKDGDLPQAGKDCIFSYQGERYKGFMYKDGALHFDDEFSPMLDIHEVDYWMEIPKLPTE